MTDTNLQLTLPLPATREDFLAMRKSKQRRTLIDGVEEYVKLLIEDEKFKAFINATNNKQAIEGAMDMDDARAAIMIQEKAQQAGDAEVGNARLNDIRIALRGALRRYRLSRKQRRANGIEAIP